MPDALTSHANGKNIAESIGGGKNEMGIQECAEHEMPTSGQCFDDLILK